MRIKDIYIDQSKKIIKKFDKLINSLILHEKDLQESKQFVLNLQKKISNIDLSPDEPLLKQHNLEKLMVEYDIKMNRLENIIKPILEEMEQLKKQSKIVYDKIMTEYSQYSEKELQEQIQKQLQE